MGRVESEEATPTRRANIIAVRADDDGGGREPALLIESLLQR